ncbi:peroxynitrite isomerase THAP4 [Rhipicephalus sanguineus]|uniref:peroxynitrite isomerase THAP4 n=1 Tax=Rhipicephalus sanguineus TaxID=34632 RepID=UPI00189338BA|nr:peroxynitrite isomerase THAP4 [Rhipicephalus sanguineus]
MPSCSVPGCRSRGIRKEPGVTFHAFPKDPRRRRLWIEAIRPGQRDWEPAKSACVCSKHFALEHFNRASPLVVRLHEDAVPAPTPLSQQRGGGAGTAATAQQDTQPEMTALSSPPGASPQQQEPMDLSEIPETLPGLSQQEPVDVADSQGSVPGPSRQEPVDVADSQGSLPGPSRQEPVDVADSEESLPSLSQQEPVDVADSEESLPSLSQQEPMDVADSQETLPDPSQQELPTLPSTSAFVETPRRRRRPMVTCSAKRAYFASTIQHHECHSPVYMLMYYLRQMKPEQWQAFATV